MTITNETYGKKCIVVSIVQKVVEGLRSFRSNCEQYRIYNYYYVYDGAQRR